jgi:demethylmenaquinone methyltransferase/2-methoxy-6-polyprenyl-1,4-benzoquinol methylase
MPINHFGVIAPYYDRIIGLRNTDRLIRISGLPCRGTLLDAGGGTGRVTEALVGLVDQVVVADESAEMLLQAVRKSGLQPVRSKVERLPFADETFERVIMIDALHHVAHQQATADELWRVLKPGGRLVVEEPDIRTLIVKLVALGEKLALMRSHFLSPKKIAGLFENKKHPSARLRIEREGWNAWVVVDKP